MGNINIDKLTKVIKSQIEEFELNKKFENTGIVLTVGDGICTCYGLDNAMMGEKISFGNNLYGLVFNLEEHTVGIILLGDFRLIKEGSIAKSTGEIFKIPVGEKLLGRVIDPLGMPLDGLGEITSKINMPIEKPAHLVIERGSVDTPLETGIMVIDSLIPIGRGQRELIIGDRQTGKTSIAIDAIINQKGKNVKCVYVAIGQKESSVAAIANTLSKFGCLSYTTIVSASASTEGSIQYLAPFSGVTIAEYFMEQKNEDVLIVYDDLSKHAVAYRELSLLLKRPPGREAYPGDVFYLHSRLLERSAKLSEKLGSGSITALPIVETKEGDISAYIPTNVISITDGQIFLETQLFYSGIRPAVNPGLSVSRVGGAAQYSAIKKVAGLLRINLASFRELESFAQFGSDLDTSSQKRLERGRKTVEILKQNIHELKPLPLQVVLLYALNNSLLDDIKIDRLQSLTTLISEKLRSDNKGLEIVDIINKTQKLPDEKLLTDFIKTCKRFV